MPADPPRLAIVGMACRYPDADTPAALFENCLAGRLSFRPIPPERLSLDAYDARVIGEADSITRVPAGLLNGWRFDPARYRIPRAAFESADLAHWLALDVAAEAIDAVGGPVALDKERTAVVVANTLTGEFSRTALLRLRWPWLDDMLEEALTGAGINGAEALAARGGFRDALRRQLRTPDEESLAGGLANTIAGRIANQFDLQGGAFSVDGACASSLVAVATAAELLASGRAAAVIVAAVDLSLDPFELVGFSRNGALAPRRMRVFDARAEGFWPGEGAAALVLMAPREAQRRGLRTDLCLAGWGMASDGSGGLTRPDAAGQRRALDQAYRSAGIDPAELGFVEAHGTGTPVGDRAEIAALADLAGPGRATPLPVASVKANIGHTKAAAGLAGLIRTAWAMKEGIIPSHSGCTRPNPVFAETGERVCVSMEPRIWPAGRRVAGVSSFGFGGINAHVVLTAPDMRRPFARPAPAPVREGELFLFRAPDVDGLRGALSSLAARAKCLSYAELGDAAAGCAADLGTGPLRLAFHAAAPEALAQRLDAALAAVDGADAHGVQLRKAAVTPRLGLIFPGQGAPVRRNGGAWAGRFPGRYPPAELGDRQGTAAAQPALIHASLAGLDLFERLGLEATAALGHSVGELMALAWAGAIPREALPGLAAVRGGAMATMPPGTMLRLSCAPDRAFAWAHGLDLAIACLNAPDETILSGPLEMIEAVARHAEQAGVPTLRLDVSHAFHSAMMAPVAGTLAEALDAIAPGAPIRPVASTITGGWLERDCDLRDLLQRQLTLPVRFDEAASRLVETVDLLVELGPGAGLARLLEARGVPIASFDVFSDEITPLLQALATLFVNGADLDPGVLFQAPGIRELPASPPALLGSPCGKVTTSPGLPPLRPAAPVPRVPGDAPVSGTPLELLFALVAKETGLARGSLSGEDRFLADLHLNSLAVSRLVARLGDLIGRRPLGLRTAFADARLRDVAEMFDDALLAPAGPPMTRIAGVAPWVRCFRTEFAPLALRPASGLRWQVARLGAPLDATGEGLAVVLDSPWEAERDAPLLLRACAEAAGRFRHLAICHRDAPLSGFARSIAAEHLFESVRLIEGGADPALLGRRLHGFEAIVASADGPATPILCPEPDPEDVPGSLPGTLLVTGGARGIGAECAVRLAELHACPTIIVGRAGPEDPEVAATLDRLRATGAEVRYVTADVADMGRLGAGVAAAAAEMGPVHMLVHAAGINQPALLADIDEALLERTLSPKAAGLDAAVAAAGPSLRRIVAFGSIIGRLGLAGEAHYALANAEQGRRLAGIAAERPHLSALAIEWSVWSGAGMGERLGAIERLAHEGVDALSLDEALDLFERLALSRVEGQMVVSSRYDGQTVPDFPRPLRFADRPLVYTPGVELVLETALNPGRDPYLLDHRLDGTTLLPGVVALEALAQAATALVPARPAAFADIHFTTPVLVGPQDTVLRIGLLAGAGGVAAELRQAADGFAAPCVEARLLVAPPCAPPPAPPVPAALPVAAAPLYGPLFFHGPAFRRLRRIGLVTSRHVAAAFAGAPSPRWFGPFEPKGLVLGDPGLRDAAIHALQCCVPHRRLVPIGTTHISFGEGGSPVRLDAQELWCRDGIYAFDILLIDQTDKVVEYWHEARFQAIGEIDIVPVLAAAPLLAEVYLERRARETVGDDSLSLALIDDPAADREARRTRAAAALGLAPPARRGDGRPVLSAKDRDISFAHAGGVTIGVSAARRVGCDIELVANFAAEELALAWTAEEALRKIGSRAALAANGQGLFTGDARERIAAFGPVPTEGAGPIAVAVGLAAGA